MLNKLKIALLAGGDSSEREVSLGSAMQVYESLCKEKYDVYVIDVRGAQWTCSSRQCEGAHVDLNDFSLDAAAGKIKLDYALIMIHGTPGEDGKLQGYLDIRQVPYSSCDLRSTVLTFDKSATKRAASEAGLATAKHVLVDAGHSAVDLSAAEKLAYPVFVKPNASGSSCGVTKVSAPDALAEAVAVAAVESPLVIVEEMVRGREMACGMVLLSDREILLPITEIVAHNDFFDYQAKYTPGLSDEITPADIDPAVARRIKEDSLRLCRSLGCRGIIRADYIVCADGTPVFIEVNSIPGMSAGSIVPKQLACAGLHTGDVFDMVIIDTIRRPQ